MDKYEVNPEDRPCKLCDHALWYHHENDSTNWYCSFADCICELYVPFYTGTEDDPIEVPYTDESYKWN